MIVLIVTYVAKEGREARLEERLREMTRLTRREPGCIDYRFWSATDDPNAILLFEQWQERQALETHLAAPHTAAFLAQIGPAVDGTLELTRFEVSDHGPLFGR